MKSGFLHLAASAVLLTAFIQVSMADQSELKITGLIDSSSSKSEVSLSISYSDLVKKFETDHLKLFNKQLYVKSVSVFAETPPTLATEAAGIRTLKGSRTLMVEFSDSRIMPMSAFRTDIVIQECVIKDCAPFYQLTVTGPIFSYPLVHTSADLSGPKTDVLNGSYSVIILAAPDITVSNGSKLSIQGNLLSRNYLSFVATLVEKGVLHKQPIESDILKFFAIFSQRSLTNFVEGKGQSNE